MFYRKLNQYATSEGFEWARNNPYAALVAPPQKKVKEAAAAAIKKKEPPPSKTAAAVTVIATPSQPQPNPSLTAFPETEVAVPVLITPTTASNVTAALASSAIPKAPTPSAATIATTVASQPAEEPVLVTPTTASHTVITSLIHTAPSPVTRTSASIMASLTSPIDDSFKTSDDKKAVIQSPPTATTTIVLTPPHTKAVIESASEIAPPGHQNVDKSQPREVENDSQPRSSACTRLAGVVAALAILYWRLSSGSTSTGLVAGPQHTVNQNPNVTPYFPWLSHQNVQSKVNITKNDVKHLIYRDARDPDVAAVRQKFQSVFIKMENTRDMIIEACGGIDAFNALPLARNVQVTLHFPIISCSFPGPIFRAISNCGREIIGFRYNINGRRDNVRTGYFFQRHPGGNLWYSQDYYVGQGGPIAFHSLTGLALLRLGLADYDYVLSNDNQPHQVYRLDGFRLDY